MEYVCIPAIGVFCYLVGEIFKLTLFKKKSKYKYIPICVGGIGGILGLMIYFFSPELLLSVDNPFTAIAVGIVSGLSSTGANQVIKQIVKGEKKDD